MVPGVLGIGKLGWAGPGWLTQNEHPLEANPSDLMNVMNVMNVKLSELKVDE